MKTIPMLSSGRLWLLVCATIVSFNLNGQNAVRPEAVQYIDTYQGLAVREMQRSGVPAAIKLAQGLLETDAGRSDLVQRSNNHFGIKCKSWWAGEKVYHDDDESGECFRKYGDPEASYRDHSDYLRSQPRYAFLFDIDPEDYKSWAHGLKKAGYATNPKYAQILIRYIEEYQLDQYTRIALGRSKPVPPVSTVVAGASQPAITGETTTIAFDNNGSTESVQTQPDPITPGPGPVATESVPDYPEGVFQINDTRVIFARAGTSLFAIAEAHQLRLSHLEEFNDLPKGQESLKKDQLVYLQRKRRQGHQEFHLVRKDESLYDISQEEAIRLENLLALNLLLPGMQPEAGEKLHLRTQAAVRPRLGMTSGAQAMFDINSGHAGAPSEEASPGQKPNAVRMIVEGKETLYGISKKYQVTTDQIRLWNNLPDDRLQAGQELVIYKNR